MRTTPEEASAELARRLAERFLLDGAKNFISDVHIIKPNDRSKWFEVKVTTQPFDALTPEQLLAEAKEEIGQLESQNEKFRECLKLIVSEIPHSKSLRQEGNAPGHCHAVPGVWDSDKGEKAGKECGWCKVWNLALSLS